VRPGTGDGDGGYAARDPAAIVMRLPGEGWATQACGLRLVYNSMRICGGKQQEVEEAGDLTRDVEPSAAG
jgi:hypothetical protein